MPRHFSYVVGSYVMLVLYVGYCFLTCWGLLASFSLVTSLRGVLPVK